MPIGYAPGVQYADLGGMLQQALAARQQRLHQQSQMGLEQAHTNLFNQEAALKDQQAGLAGEKMGMYRKFQQAYGQPSADASGQPAAPLPQPAPMSPMAPTATLDTTMAAKPLIKRPDSVMDSGVSVGASTVARARQSGLTDQMRQMGTPEFSAEQWYNTEHPKTLARKMRELTGNQDGRLDPSLYGPDKLVEYQSKTVDTRFKAERLAAQELASKARMKHNEALVAAKGNLDDARVKHWASADDRASSRLQGYLDRNDYVMNGGHLNDQMMLDDNRSANQSTASRERAEQQRQTAQMLKMLGEAGLNQRQLTAALLAANAKGKPPIEGAENVNSPGAHVAVKPVKGFFTDSTKLVIEPGASDAGSATQAAIGASPGPRVTVPMPATPPSAPPNAADAQAQALAAKYGLKLRKKQ